MTPIAVLLITISAFGHAFWNFFSQRRSPTLAFFWLASLGSVVILAPMLAAYAPGLAYLTAVNWLLIALTGAFQAVYYFGLAGAYRSGDLSLAYPLARALPVLLVAGISVALGRGSQIGMLAMLGFIAISAGCLILPMQGFASFRWGDFFTACCLFAVVAALGTTGYTLVDDQVLRDLRTVPGIPLQNHELTLLFMALENISLSAAMGVYLLSNPSERRILKQWKALWWPACFTGLVMTAAYGLVLAAMAYVSNVSYVSAFRQLSIPIGAAMGIFLRNEACPLPKLAGLGLIVAGLVAVALSKG